MGKKFSIKLSGVGTTKGNNGRLRCSYIYASSSASADVNKESLTYENILTEYRDQTPFLITFSEDNKYRVENYSGLFAVENTGNSYSFYRREYEIYERTYYDENSQEYKKEYKEYQGEWKPVAVNLDSSSFRDFNISSGRRYQYILYPNYTAMKQQYAISYDSDIPIEESHLKGDSFKAEWYEWSLTELEPVENEVNAPIIKKTYKADVNNIWLFKYNLSTGEQTQNLSKNEVSTLGMYPKVGYGIKNYVSGSVSCYLGSEIIPYTNMGYVERLRDGISAPLSANEKVRMLEQWRKIVYSKNPKLLKDIKGQSWIVQIFTGSNTPNNFYKNQPDMISFTWKQIEDPNNCIIYGSGETLNKTGECDTIWKKIDKYPSGGDNNG